MTATKVAYPPTPELNKLKRVAPVSQQVHDFVETYLREKGGYTIGRPHEHGPTCKGWDPDRDRYCPRGDERCSFNSGEFEGIGIPLRKMLAEFFEIDEEKCEKERRAILDHLNPGG